MAGHIQPRRAENCCRPRFDLGKVFRVDAGQRGSLSCTRAGRFDLSARKREGVHATAVPRHGSLG
eukprot:15468264-Heterocapsa_arctica.AAC.1